METANTVFTVLTFVANVGFVALVVVGLLAASGRRAGIARRVVDLVGPRGRVLALVVAAVATTGSLYYSEVEGFIPCELCWFQRICMYPLFAILAVGVLRASTGRLASSAPPEAVGKAAALRGDRNVGWYAAPFVGIGAPLALYHWLVERVPALEDSTSCTVGVPCSVPYFEKLGYVTLAFMDMSAFLLIGALLLTARARDRQEATAA